MRGRFPLLAIQFENTIGLRFLRRFLLRLGTAEPDAVIRCALFLFVAPAFFTELVQIFDIRHSTASFKPQYTIIIFKQYLTIQRAKTKHGARSSRRIG